MRHRGHLPDAERQAISRLHALLTRPGLLHGSLQANRRRCGNPTCRCSRGRLHTSPLLRVVEGGKQVSIHVPATWEARVRAWLGRDREIRQLLSRLAAMYTSRLRRRKE